MKVKRAMGFVLSIIAIVIGITILIQKSGLAVFFSAMGIVLVIVSVSWLCVWLIMSDQ